MGLGVWQHLCGVPQVLSGAIRQRSWNPSLAVGEKSQEYAWVVEG